MPILRVEYHVFHLGFVGGEHRHEHHELLLIEGGRFRTRFAGQEHEIGPGGLVWYAAGIPHQPVYARTAIGTSAWYVAWTGDPMPEPLAGSRADEATRIRPCGSWLYDLWSARRAEAEDLLRVIWAELQRPDEHDASTDHIELLRRYIHQHRDKMLTLDQLTKFLGSSARSVQRRFKARFHCSPMAYHQRCRAELAASLLTGTTLPIGVIAERVGLADGSALGRLIRSQYGMSPSALRAS